MKNVRLFARTAHVLKLRLGSKFEPRALQGVYLETLDCSVFTILVTDDDGIRSIKDSQHVIFDELKFLEASNVDGYLDPEVQSDIDYETAESISESYSVISDNISVEESEVDQKNTDG